MQWSLNFRYFEIYFFDLETYLDDETLAVVLMRLDNPRHEIILLIISELLTGACVISEVRHLRDDVNKFRCCHCPSQDLLQPSILAALQKSVQSVLLGKTERPDWFFTGAREDSLLDSFPISGRFPLDYVTIRRIHNIFQHFIHFLAPITTWPSSSSNYISGLPDANDNDGLKHQQGHTTSWSNPYRHHGDGLTSALASDGRYLYIHDQQGLHKVGTGEHCPICRR